jgi:LuxR family maltose regulon positive regulatory protein
VLLRLNTPVSCRQAEDALARVDAFVTTTHNTRFRIEVLALRALCYDAQGDHAAALQTLEQALALARPGGFVRVFVDLGPALAGLLQRLARRVSDARYIDALIEAFPAAPARDAHALAPSNGQTAAAVLVEPLTSRELDVLALLAQRYSAKEIAQHLVISNGTVKRHIANIYGKLAANNRRTAVAAAAALGILPEQR